MSKQITIHLRQDYTNNGWKSVDLTLLEEDHAYGPHFIILRDGEEIGRIARHDDHVSHQVHGRLRYDNRPRTAWQILRFKEGMGWTGNGIYLDTRNEVLARVLDVYDLHLPGRCPSWQTCPFCLGAVR